MWGRRGTRRVAMLHTLIHTADYNVSLDDWHMLYQSQLPRGPFLLNSLNFSPPQTRSYATETL